MRDLEMMFKDNNCTQSDMEIYINRTLFSDFYSNDIDKLEIMSEFDYGETNSQLWRDLNSENMELVSQ